MKIQIIFFIFTALVLFNGSSPWEGAATVAPESELPIAGFFIATNSFPRNSVVDITNIETGRSTRVIVANTINNPGLIAIVSREAADLIGMRPGSTSRIRMISPSDPIAFQRFIEGMAAETPPFVSGNVFRSEEELLAEVYRDDDRFTEPAVVQEPQAPAAPPVQNEPRPNYIMEPEWGGNARLEIVNVPRFNETPVDLQPEPVEIVEPEPEADPEPVYIVEPEPAPEPEPVFIVLPEPEADPEPVYIVEPEPAPEPEPVFIAEPEPEAYPEPVHIAESEPAPEPDPVYIAEPEPEPVYVAVEEPIETAQEPEIPEVIVQVQEQRLPEFNIVRAEERIPENGSIYGIDPNDIIPSITPVVSAPPASRLPTPRPAAPAPERPAPPVAVNEFSIPRITNLDRGQFYVQIAALPTPELVENTVRQINLNYNPVVLVGSDNLYRILIGPLNQ